MCVVEVEGRSEPVKACGTVVFEGLAVQTGTAALADLRKARLDGFLANHNAYCAPPCQAACPAGIDIAGYIAMIGKGDYGGAVALIKEKLPLPGILGRICPRPCEDRCRRLQIDGQAVSICALKRYAADKARAAGQPTQPARSPPPVSGWRLLARGHRAYRRPTIWRSKAMRLRCSKPRKSLAAPCALAFHPIACPIASSTKRLPIS